MITNKRIIYDNENNGIAIIIPAPQWKGTINELGAKDVPTGVPYLIVDAEDVPKDRTLRALWTADFSNPDGYGE